MKRILILIAGMSFLFSCNYINGPTTVNKEITSDYLLEGNLAVYLSNNQVFRYKGKPGTETILIGNSDLSKYEDCFILHVGTGTTNATAVSSAEIKLDGLDVLNSSDFSKNASQHSLEICNLTPTSVLTVEVKGQPGSYLDIWIEGKLKDCIDVDGNAYRTKKIGNQTWMAENLRTTRLNNGTVIPLVADDAEWMNLRTPGYCWFKNDAVAYKDNGILYNWYTVNTGKLCPSGWHAPTSDEWTELANYLGGYETGGGKLKETGSIHWEAPNTGATNSSGFNGIGGGARTENSTFAFLNTYGFWWSSSEYEGLPDVGYGFSLNNLYPTADYNYTMQKWGGYYVRCLKN